MTYKQFSRQLFRNYFRDGGNLLWLPVVVLAWLLATAGVLATVCICSFVHGTRTTLDGFEA